MSVDRSQIILDVLEERSSVSVVELSQILRVSEVTVRKILDEMEVKGMLKRTWGGAVSLSGSQKELEHSSKAVKHMQEKRAIAAKAYSMIDDGDAIFLDSGSTTMELAKLIVAGSKKNLMIGTNAINIAYELSNSKDASVIVTGGELRKGILSCVGPIAENTLQRTFYDKYFFSAYHCTVERGFTTPNSYEAQLKVCVMKVCKQNIALLDHSKFGNDSMMQIANVGDIDYIITDERIDQNVYKKISDMNVNILIAPALETY